MHGGVVHPGHGKGQDEMSKRIVEHRPYIGGGQVPEAYVDSGFFAPLDRHDHLNGKLDEDDLDRNAHPEGEFTRFNTAVVAQHQGDDPDRQADVPEPEDAVVPAFLVHPHTAQLGHNVIGQPKYGGGESAEDDAHDMHGPQTAPGQPRDVSEEIV